MVQMDFLPLLWSVRTQRDRSVFWTTIYFFPTILWVDGWFYWSYLDSLGQLQSDNSRLTGWEIHACSVHVSGRWCCLPLPWSTLVLLIWTPSRGPHRQPFYSILSFVPLPFPFHFAVPNPWCSWYILASLVRRSCEGCGRFMPLCSSVTPARVLLFSFFSLLPLIFTASITSGTSLYFWSVTIHSLEWICKMEKHGKFSITKYWLFTVLIYMLWFSAKDFFTSMPLQVFSLLFSILASFKYQIRLSTSLLNTYFLILTKNILRFHCLFSIFSLSQYGNKMQWFTPKTAQLEPSEHSLLNLLPRSHTLCCCSFKHFDTHLGLLSQVFTLYSIQRLGGLYEASRTKCNQHTKKQMGRTRQKQSESVLYLSSWKPHS